MRTYNQQKYIIPLTDFGIAHIFDVKTNYDLLMGFLEVMHDDPTIKEKPVIGNLFPLKFIHIDLPKFTKTEAELKTHLDKWFYALVNMPELDSRPKKLSEPIFVRLFEAAEIDKLTPEEYAAYQRSVKHYRDLRNIVDTAREDARASVGG